MFGAHGVILRRGVTGEVPAVDVIVTLVEDTTPMDIRMLGDHLEDWRETVIASIDATRPPGEVWTVTASEVATGVLSL
jgi:hypothetical protein